MKHNLPSKQRLLDWSKRDRYKRIVGKITHQRRDINLQMVRTWLARRIRSIPGITAQGTGYCVRSGGDGCSGESSGVVGGFGVYAVLRLTASKKTSEWDEELHVDLVGRRHDGEEEEENVTRNKVYPARTISMLTGGQAYRTKDTEAIVR